MKQKVYIAGKVTGLKRIECAVKFNRAKKKLLEAGFYVVNPLTLVPFDACWKVAMRKCITALMECESVYLLHDWHESKGARVEVEIAKAFGMNFLYAEGAQKVEEETKVDAENLKGLHHTIFDLRLKLKISEARLDLAKQDVAQLRAFNRDVRSKLRSADRKKRSSFLKRLIS